MFFILSQYFDLCVGICEWKSLVISGVKTRFSQCLCQLAELGRCEQKRATCLLMDIPFFLYRVLYLTCSTWHAKAFCMIPKNSFYTQVARGNKESKETWWIPLSQSVVGGWIWFSLLLTCYIFWMPDFRAYMGLFFFAMWANLHWPGLALHLSRTSHSEKNSSRLLP